MFKLLAIATFATLANQQTGIPPAVFSSPSETAEPNETQFGDPLRRLGLYQVQEIAPEIVSITPASAVIKLDQATVFTDPVGPQSNYALFSRPDIVVLTRAHPDHLSIETMIGMLRRDTVVLAPRAVIDQLPLMIANNTIAPFSPGTTREVSGIRFTALPLSAIIPSAASVYQRQRGDIGVIMEVEGTMVYF